MSRAKKLVRASKGPVVVLVWDGFGISKMEQGNAIRKARMPHWKRLLKAYPNTVLRADGLDVGLPSDQPGNSESGHATLGAGRPVPSDQFIIDQAIRDHSFENNPALLQAVAHCIRNGGTLHLMGLLTGPKSGHASPKHVQALLNFVDRLRVPRVALHLFTDGRDSSPFHAANLLRDLEKTLPEHCVIASLMGRFYAMDRNRVWERTAMAYEALVEGKGVTAESATQALTQAYARGESDEFITPTVICRRHLCVAPILDHDAVVFWNLRSDRARQLVKPFVMHQFEHVEHGGFHRDTVRKDVVFVTLTEFGKELNGTLTAFPHREIHGTLVEALRYHKQLYAAESEKFSQVTYFLNGGYDRPRFGEDRIRVPSLQVPRVDEHPRMRSDELARRLVAALHGGYDFALANFANADMVGHTGNEQAAVLACEALDDALGRVWSEVKRRQGTLLVTADHGNAEVMRTHFGGADTEHNPDPVPFLAAGIAAQGRKLRRGTLADVAPTILKLLGIQPPQEMTGHALLI